MKSVITYDTLRDFAYCNDALVQGTIRGVILEFMGLNGAAMYDAHTQRGVELAAKGIVLLIPYCNPWNWMNAQAVAYTEELLDALFGHYGLPRELPTVATGGSMGGLCALVYAHYARRTPVACAVNCPVCDLPFHYTERPDLPRTLYSAFGGADFETLEEAMRACSPLHLAARMPKIPYTVFHCEEDSAVNIHSHAEKFVDAMRPSHEVEFIRVPGRDHCDLDEPSLALYRRRAEEAILGK